MRSVAIWLSWLSGPDSHRRAVVRFESSTGSPAAILYTSFRVSFRDCAVVQLSSHARISPDSRLTAKDSVDSMVGPIDGSGRALRS